MEIEIEPRLNEIKNSEISKTDDHDFASDSRFRFEPPLYIQRYDYVMNLVNKFECKTYMDIGCAECKLLKYLKNSNETLNLIVGLDIDEEILENSREKFSNILFDYLQLKERPLDIYLIKGDVSLQNDYLLDRMCYENSGLDFVSMVEIIEHMYPETLERCIKIIFNTLKPRLVLITTPNSEFNVVFDDLEKNNEKINQPFHKTNKFRHWDHKFEWTREEFQSWCKNEILDEYKYYDLYNNEFDGLGVAPVGYENVGFCTQSALFIRNDLNKTEKAGSLNKFQTYLRDRKKLNHYNNKLKLSDRNSEKKEMDLYFTEEGFKKSKTESLTDLEPENFKLIMSLACPFECFEYETENERNKALLSEINYLIIFLSSGYRSSSYVENENDYETLTDEQKEKLDNDIDLYSDEIKLASFDKLCEFKSVQKFKLNNEKIRDILIENGYVFTKSKKYLIYEPSYESDDGSHYDDYNDDGYYNGNHD